MIKDSQKLKVELMKIKMTSERQAAVLKRKIEQASAKEKARAEMERKRCAADKMRLASSSISPEDRKAELSSWIDREVEYSLIKHQIDEQRRELENAVSERRQLVKNSGGDTFDVNALEVDATILSLRATVQELEMAVHTSYGSSTSPTFRFLDTEKFKGLSKQDAKCVLSYIFDTCSSLKKEMALVVSEQAAKSTLAVDSALAKERQLHEEALTKIKTEHVEVTLNLLESAQGMVNSHIKLKMDSKSTAGDVQTQEGVLATYNECWDATTKALKSDLTEIKRTQEGLQTMLDNMAKGMAFVAQKPKAKRKEVEHDYDSEAFESEESFNDDDGEDSEYEPTPAKAKRNRRSPRLAKKAAVPPSPASPIGENFIDDLDNKRVGSLKKACKVLGLSVTGKKADLKQRVRETVLNSSLAAQPATKTVNFEADFLEVGSEFEPVDEVGDKSIKKKLWEEPSADVSKPSAVRPKPTEAKVKDETPSKKRKKTSSPEKENGNITPKRQRPLGFLTSSPRPMAAYNDSRTPVEIKQT